MNPTRCCVLIFALTAVALGNVHLLARQRCMAAELVGMESEWIQQRREWWSLQARSARLRSPEHIHRRIEVMQTDLIPPGFEAMFRSPAGIAWNEYGESIE